MVRESEAETAGLAFAAHDRRKTGEFRDKELIVIDKGVIIIKQGIFFALGGHGEGLRGGSGFGDDSD